MQTSVAAYVCKIKNSSIHTQRVSIVQPNRLFATSSESKSYVPISLLSLNCYLVPQLFTYRKVNSGCVRQEERSSWIGQRCLKSDICVLQEVWGSYVGNIETPLKNSHYIFPFGSTNTPFGFHKVLDPAYFWMKKTGGLWFAFKRDINLIHASQHTFSVSESNSKKGVMCVVLDVSHFWPNKHLMIFNTHLDPMNMKNKKQQIMEIQSFIAQTTDAVRTTNKWTLEYFERNVAALVIGDFNIPSTMKNECKFIMDSLQANDLYTSFCKEHNVEETSTYEPHNSLYTLLPKKELNIPRRIDYIFGIKSIVGADGRPPTKFMQIKAQDFKIEKRDHLKELSDHWAQSLAIIPQ